MPMMFGFHNFYDLNSGAILALPHQPSVSTYYKHGIAICHNPHLHIDLKLPIYGQKYAWTILQVIYLSVIVVTWFGPYTMTNRNCFIKISSSKFEFLEKI